MKVSIIMPCYNERELLPKCLKKVEQAPVPKGFTKEIILIDDCSTDGTREYLKKIKKHKVFFHQKNRGKGGAVKTGFKHATGDIYLIQDADLEYEPKDYPKLLRPFTKGAQVVYGSRTKGKNKKKHSHLSFYLGGLGLNVLASVLYGQIITDEATCYKVFRKEVIKGIKIEGERFEWEPEVLAKIRKKGIHIHEVPIRYYPRSLEEGKKISWKDGAHAIWTLLKYRIVD